VTAQTVVVDSSPLTGESTTLDRLQRTIEHAAELLPAQGPITVFIHHNTLHAFEDLSFDAAVQRGAAIFGCQPYLPEERYRQMLAVGRIRRSDLTSVLRDDLGERADEPLCVKGTRLSLRLAMLEHPLRTGPAEELRWFVAETDALQHFLSHVPPEVREPMIAETRQWVMHELANGRGPRHDSFRPMLDDLVRRLGASRIDDWTADEWESLTLQALWRICRHGAHASERSPQAESQPVRHRDLLLERTGVDTDELVHDVLIRLCAAYSDQGVAHWTLPRRIKGFWEAFCRLYEGSRPWVDSWVRPLARELRRLRRELIDPLASVLESLELLGVPEGEWESFLVDTLLALRGWAGMMRQNEIRPDRVAHPAAEGTVVEYLAVRLVLERMALAHVARTELDFDQPLAHLRQRLHSERSRHRAPGIDQRAFRLFQLAQALGWTPVALRQLPREHWTGLLAEVESFGELERRRVLHGAFERRFRIQTLDALTLHAGASPARPLADRPTVQAVFCLDEREESIRRHLEEIAPEAETFGVAGFFNAAMYYRGAADAHFVPLCPVVVRPQHWVVEDVAYRFREEHALRTRARRALGTLSHRLHIGSRTLGGGALLSMGLGVLASIPLVARVLFPGIAGRFRRTAGRFLEPPPVTRLQLERAAPDPGPEDGHCGYSLTEMANVGERLLRDIGLVCDFARLVVLIGHGSGSLNNPHKSAYDCGACGGNAGAPNARAAAEMLNDLRVRELLEQRGIAIPDDTVFVGGFHHTCSDAAVFYDLERLPKSHEAEFEEFHRHLDAACERNAHERCRRFLSAPLNMSFAAAREHVFERTEDLAQTRPECGHATNAICVVGRRSRTRGLFLDRRAFLTSYDPTQDTADYAILTRILQAVFPVCAGINLEYYFSYVDSAGWGCGTKLPHNVSALLGVMDGPASDLRTGLPWQMVEIHEPVRLLIVVENTPEAMLQIMERNEGIRKLCLNQWVQLATLADSGEVLYFRNGRFEAYQPEAAALPNAPSSTEWYRGLRDHLQFAQIGGGA
jgi:uncharacterized protein YbcC (UPF0753/DUF2309 family)